MSRFASICAGLLLVSSLSGLLFSVTVVVAAATLQWAATVADVRHAKAEPVEPWLLVIRPPITQAFRNRLISLLAWRTTHLRPVVSRWS